MHTYPSASILKYDDPPTNIPIEKIPQLSMCRRSMDASTRMFVISCPSSTTTRAPG